MTWPKVFPDFWRQKQAGRVSQGRGVVRKLGQAREVAGWLWDCRRHQV